MPDKIPFLKVYCSAELRDVVKELAKLKGMSAGAVIREFLDDAQIEKELYLARAKESQRLATLQQVEAHRLGQADWVTGSQQAAAPEPKRKHSDRGAGRGARGKKTPTRGTVTAAGKRKRGGR